MTNRKAKTLQSARGSSGPQECSPPVTFEGHAGGTRLLYVLVVGTFTRKYALVARTLLGAPGRTTRSKDASGFLSCAAQMCFRPRWMCSWNESMKPWRDLSHATSRRHAQSPRPSSFWGQAISVENDYEKAFEATTELTWRSSDSWNGDACL